MAIKSATLVVVLSLSAAVVGFSGIAASASQPSFSRTLKADVVIVMGTDLRWAACASNRTDDCATEVDLGIAVTNDTIAFAIYRFSKISASKGNTYLKDIGLTLALVTRSPAAVSWFEKTAPKIGSPVKRTFGSWVVEQKVLSADSITYEVGMTPAY